MKKIKLITLALVSSVSFTLAANAATIEVQYPSKPGAQGTTLWGDTTVKELQKYTEHTLVPRFKSGARGKISLKSYSKSDKSTLLITHGGNGESFLMEDVGDFDYAKYDAMVIMNSSMWISKVTNRKGIMTFPLDGGSGFGPDWLSVGMMECGPKRTTTVDNFLSCVNTEMKLIGGFKKGGMRRKAFNDELLQGSRDTMASALSASKRQYDAGTHEVWYSHGIVSKDGKVGDPNNEKGKQTFEEAYNIQHGVMPSGPVYNAYVLNQAYRDGIQKAMFTHKDNPYKDDISKAVSKMLANPESVAKLQSRLGLYPWLNTNDSQDHANYITSIKTDTNSKDLLRIAKEWFRYDVKKENKETLFDSFKNLF